MTFEFLLKSLGEMIKILLQNLRYPAVAIFAIIASGCRDEAGPVGFARDLRTGGSERQSGYVCR